MLHSSQHIQIRSERVRPRGDSEAAVAEFIRTRGITRCPTACVSPTQGLIAASDRAALEAHAVERERIRRAKLAAREQVIWGAAAPISASVEERPTVSEESDAERQAADTRYREATADLR
jgi:hypothetical protein